jgi:hypothetical protein
MSILAGVLLVVTVPSGNALDQEIGGAEEDRTPDLLIANETLSQLSYGPTAANRHCHEHSSRAGTPEIRRHRSGQRRCDP